MPVDPTVARYLREFGRELRRLPEPDRLDAVREIESHLDDELRGGESAEAAIARLGPPQTLARAYLSAFHLRGTAPGTARASWEMLAAMAFFASAGVGGLFIVPSLGLMLLVLGLTSVVAPLAGVARALGVHGVTMSGPGGPLPLAWSIPVGLGLGLVAGLAAAACWLLLRLYFALVARGSRRWLQRGALGWSAGQGG
jgi:uncharacterized membrane protein